MAFQTAQVGARHPSQYRKILLRDAKAFAPCPLFVYPFDMIQVIPPSVVTFHIFCCAVPKSFKPRHDAVLGTLRRLAIGDLHPPVRYRGLRVWGRPRLRRARPGGAGLRLRLPRCTPPRGLTASWHGSLACPISFLCLYYMPAN